MKIEHIAIWTDKLEEMKDFYTRYFGAKPNNKYTNENKGFQSYFLSFESGARLEIMSRIDISSHYIDRSSSIGITHLAFKVGSKEGVLELTNTLRKNGYTITGEPRTTGDGYFESIILDVDGNSIELVA